MLQELVSMLAFAETQAPPRVLVLSSAFERFIGDSFDVLAATRGELSEARAALDGLRRHTLRVGRAAELLTMEMRSLEAMHASWHDPTGLVRALHEERGNSASVARTDDDKEFAVLREVVVARLPTTPLYPPNSPWRVLDQRGGLRFSHGGGTTSERAT